MYRQSNIIEFPFDRRRLQTLVKGNKRFLNGDVQETGHFDPSSAISDRWEVGRCTQRERGRLGWGSVVIAGKGISSFPLFYIIKITFYKEDLRAKGWHGVHGISSSSVSLQVTEMRKTEVHRTAKSRTSMRLILFHFSPCAQNILTLPTHSLSNWENARGQQRVSGQTQDRSV